MAATFVVENGSGLSNANSYVSVADATQYHENHGTPTAWTNASTAAKEDALRQATQYLDAVYGTVWDGTRINETMALDWPRYGAVDSDGFWLVATAVPQQVKDACAYLALKQIGGDTLLPDDAAASNVEAESLTLGALSISTSYSGQKNTAKYYKLVEKLIGSLTTGTGRVYRA